MRTNKVMNAAVAAAFVLLATTAAAPLPRPVGLEVKAGPSAAYATRHEGIRLSVPEPSAATRGESPSVAPSLTDLYVTIPSAEGGERLMRVESTGHLWDERASSRIVLSRKQAARLRSEAERLRKAHYGRLTDWNEAKRMLPRRSVFSITDVESGLTFRVQRRAGSDHADVQPLTKEDTRIMRRIYKDGWSWRRKAIIVGSEGRRLAASMNGMPHGGDGIPGNGFSGHFCVHFLNSSTHRSEKPDPEHQLMVYKAAGRLREMLDGSPPLAQARYLAAAMDQNETELVRLMTEGMPLPESAGLVAATAKFASFRAGKIAESKPDPATELTAVVELDAVFQSRGKPSRRETVRLSFARLSPLSPWRLDDCEFIPIRSRSPRRS